jgi:O-antigen/teichoic acid export membrane protein
LRNQLSIYIREIENIANKGFFYLFTSQGLIVIVGFASQFFVAGILDPADMGRIKIMQTYINLSALICGLGFETSLLTLVSASGDDAEKRRLYQAALLVSMGSFALLFAVLSVFSYLGIISADPVITRLFPLYMLFLLPLTVQNLQMAYYQATKRIKTMARLQLIVKSVTVALLIYLTYLFQLKGYIITIVVTGMLTVLIFQVGLKNIRLNRDFFSINAALVKRMWKLAAYALLANIVGLVTTTLDIYLVNYMIAERVEVGYYMFALTIISVYQLVPLTIQQVSLPYFSEQASDYTRWYRSYSKYNRLNHVLVALVVAAGIVTIPFLIGFAFSGKYDRSVYYFVFLAVAWMIKNSSVIKPTAIMGHGRFDINFKVSLINFALSLPILFVLINFYGLDGALIGKVIAAVIYYITTTAMFRKFNNSL